MASLLVVLAMISIDAGIMAYRVAAWQIRVQDDLLAGSKANRVGYLHLVEEADYKCDFEQWEVTRKMTELELSGQPKKKQRRAMTIIVALLLGMPTGMHMYETLITPPPTAPLGLVAYIGGLFGSLVVVFACLSAFLVVLFVERNLPEPTEEDVAEIRLLLYIGDRPDADDLLKKFQALPLVERQQLLDRIEACPSNVLTQALLDWE